MADRVATVEEAAAAFVRLADAEGERIPLYARLCREIAADPALAGLLLEAPTGQRLPVLLLAALHAVVLEHPDAPLAPWFPTVHPGPPPQHGPGGALRATLATYLDRVLHLLRTRQVQTNEVNRSCAWWLALGALTEHDARPLHLVELGASAGLNLAIGDYAYEFERADGPTTTVGDAGSPVRLHATLRGDLVPAAQLGAPIESAVGIDQRPVDLHDPADVRWLEACVWPEQQARVERLRAALAVAARRPPRVVAGDLVDDLPPLLDAVQGAAHTVVLSSWVFAYVPRPRREELLGVLDAAAQRSASRGGRLTLLTLEADSALPWVTAPALAANADADDRFASVLAATCWDDHGARRVEVLGRCQAHLVWANLRAPAPPPSAPPPAPMTAPGG
ncbi:MAG: DUF2332 domain-containing protein [Microthrixaceae bacterium]